ncbi:potassium voltage-gated channel protein Shal-like [Branchiostoma lanceolatum]|uniref:potassium voltage-gated channel protein Shal-like n=1 Tax=Branchiostoma lanceolatum TaxID=7740 RepID=UPI0034569125
MYAVRGGASTPEPSRGKTSRQQEALTRAPLETFRKQAKRIARRRSDKVVLRVGGTRFQVSKHILDFYPNTLLGSEERERFFDTDCQEYVFPDRDPEIFRYVLSYYQTGMLHFPFDEELLDYEQELLSFGFEVDQLKEVISSCCLEFYEDKQEALEKCKPFLKKQMAQSTPRTIRERLHYMIENPKQTIFGAAFFWLTSAFIALSVTANVVENSIYSLGKKEGEFVYVGEAFTTPFSVLEVAVAVIFTLEYIIRLYVAPNRCKHVRQFMSVVDLVSILPFYISLMLPQKSAVTSAFVTLRVLRVFRVFKLARHSEKLKRLGYVVKNSMKDLGFLVFTMLITVVLFSIIVYQAERGVPDSPFISVPHTFWYIIVTMVTLGYGDMVAVTIFGKVVTGICMISSVILLTLPVTVVIGNYNELCRSTQDMVRLKRKGCRCLAPERKARQSQDTCTTASDQVINHPTSTESHGNERVTGEYEGTPILTWTSSV